MATTTTQKPSLAQLSTDPLRNFKFQVKIHLAGSTLDSSKRSNQLGFMSVSGLSITTDVVVYRQGGMNAQPLSAKVLTPGNGYKPMGDIAVGDAVMDPRGQESHVTGVYPQGVRPVFEVIAHDGARAEACYQHLWEVEVEGSKGSRVIPTLEVKRLIEEGAEVHLPALERGVFDAVRTGPSAANERRRVTQVNYLRDDEVQCIAVSADSRLYITDDLLPTHNTTTQKMPGQAQPLDAQVLTPNGFKPMRDVRVGDAVMDPRGEASTVLGVYPQGVLPVYEVTTTDGRRTRACYRHRWEVEADDGPPQVVTTVEMQQLLKAGASLSLPRLHPAVGEVPGATAQDIPPTSAVQDVVYVGEEEVQCIAVSAKSHLYITDELIPTHNSDFAPITLSRGLICGDSDIHAWLKQIFMVMQGTGGNNGSSNFRATMDIFLLDHPVTTQTVTYKAGWRVYNCWPTSIAWGDLDAGANGVELQQITLAHEGFDFKIANKYGPGAGISLP